MEEQKVLDESLGEVLCDKCDGKGWEHGEMVNYSTMSPGMPWRCKKCKGEGKLDWIENAVGKRPQTTFVKPGVYVKEIDVSEFVPLSGIDNEIINQFAEQMAAEIDRDIIEELTKSLLVPKEILGVK